MFSTQYRQLLRPLLVMLLVGGLASPAFAARGPQIVDAKVGEAAPLAAQDANYLFTLQGAAYTLGWYKHRGRFTPTEDEKMLVIRYRVANQSEKTRRFSYRELSWKAFDSAGKEIDSFEGPRALGSTALLETSLDPQQAVDLYGAFLVPAESAISSVQVQAKPGDEPALRFDLKGKVDALPDRYSADGVALRSPLSAKVRDTVPLAGFDVKIGSFSTSTDALYDGRTPSAGKVWGVLPLTVTSRYQDGDVRIRNAIFRPTVVVDATGRQFEPYAMVGGDNDQLVSETVTAAESYDVRLLYRLNEETEISGLRLQSTMPARSGRSYQYRVAVSSRGEAEQARDRMVLGGGTPVADISGMSSKVASGRFASGVYDPEGEVQISIVDAGDAGGIPEGSSKKASAENSSEAEDLSAYKRDAAWAVNAVRDAGGPDENGGDEFYFTLGTYRGILGSNDFDLNVRTVRGKRGSDWVKGTGEVILLDDLSTNWIELPAYSVYGLVVMVNEDDRSTQAELDAMERGMEDELRRRLRRAFAPDSELPAPVNASREVQLAHAEALGRVGANVSGDGDAARDILSALYDIQSAATGGLSDDDDFVSAVSLYWINLPTLDPGEVLGELTGPSGTGAYGAKPPGEFWISSFWPKSDEPLLPIFVADPPRIIEFRFNNSLFGAR